MPPYLVRASFSRIPFRGRPLSATQTVALETRPYVLLVARELLSTSFSVSIRQTSRWRFRCSSWSADAWHCKRRMSSWRSVMRWTFRSRYSRWLRDISAMVAGRMYQDWRIRTPSGSVPSFYAAVLAPCRHRPDLAGCSRNLSD